MDLRKSFCPGRCCANSATVTSSGGARRCSPSTRKSTGPCAPRPRTGWCRASARTARWVRAAGLRQGRQGHPDRGRPGLARQPGPAVPQGFGQRAAGRLATAGRHRCSTGARTAPTGSRWTWRPPWTWSRTGSSRPGADLAVGARRAPLRRTLGIATLGGATLDNEENYLIKKLFTALGVVQVENQARVCHSSTSPGSAPRSDGAAPPPSCRTCRTPTASSSRVRTSPRPPGRLPVGDGGEGARRQGHPRRPALHPYQRLADLTCRSGRAVTSRCSAGSSTTSSRRSRTSASTSWPTPTPPPRRRRLP